MCLVVGWQRRSETALGEWRGVARLADESARVLCVLGPHLLVHQLVHEVLLGLAEEAEALLQVVGRVRRTCVATRAQWREGW
jgi:hypothetical protein